jgi:hypothetical protein
MLASCISQPVPQPVYNPAKNYAAFLVLNNPNSAKILDEVKITTVSTGLEIGPIEYYDPGTTDFEPVIKKLTPSKQISVLWVVGNIMDSTNISKGIAKSSFKGEMRLKPVSGPTTQ